MHSPINRRTFLQASGVAMALPLLESMSPAMGANSVEQAPKRMVLICTTLGLHPPALWPETTGENYESTEYLELLKEHRKNFTLFSGLSHESQTGRQPHDSEITFLTSARKPGVDGFRNTISIDQVAASTLGYTTRYPSIALSSDSKKSQSYMAGGVMVPAENSPSELFSSLFLQGKPDEVLKQKRQLSDGRSILDQLDSQTTKLRRTASDADNDLLDEYFESVRQAEKDIAEVQGWMEKTKPTVEAEQPRDIADRRDILGRMQLLMDMIPLIVQTDSSRVVTVMIQDHYVVPVVDGVSENHHNLSHHGQDKAKIDQLHKIETGLVSCFGNLLGQMKSKTETGSTLLDNTSILFGSNLGNANAHDARNLPIFLAGGNYKHGRYVSAKDGGKDKPLCNLFVKMLNDMSVETESFGQSSGELSW